MILSRCEGNNHGHLFLYLELSTVSVCIRLIDNNGFVLATNTNKGQTSGTRERDERAVDGNIVSINII